MSIIIGGASGLSFTVAAPNQTKPGQWFDVNVTIETSQAENITVYSYVYKNLDCVSQGWTANKQSLELEPGTQTIVLKDMVKYNTLPGIYNLRVRVNSSSGLLNSTQSIYVFEGTTWLKESYLYAILILISVAGIAIVFRFNR